MLLPKLLIPGYPLNRGSENEGVWVKTVGGKNQGYEKNIQSLLEICTAGIGIIHLVHTQNVPKN